LSSFPSTIDTAGVAVTTLRIKNMVCNRCIRVVREELSRLNVSVRSVTLGEVVVEGDAKLPISEIRAALEGNGFELIEDKRLATVERIKRSIIEHVRRDPESAGGKASAAIAKAVGADYDSLSALFSSIEQVTIEQYTILQRIEYVKELLKYGELTLGEIAFRTGYSSVQHLSRQFKQVTGLTATEFKRMTTPQRTPIDRVAGSR
jgi:AraC family transcriptional regulator